MLYAAAIRPLTFGLTESFAAANGVDPPRDEVLLTDRTLDLPFGRI